MANLPKHAQVVIIGGGVGGCSIAYHLTLMGWKDVVLLERHELTRVHLAFGGTGGADALGCQPDAHDALQHRPVPPAEGGDRAGHLLARSGRPAPGILAERMEEIKRLVGMARSFGVPMELISPKEAQEMFPLMSIDGVVAQPSPPTTGVIDPTGLTNALAAGAKSRGAQIFTGHQRGEDQPEERPRRMRW